MKSRFSLTYVVTIKGQDYSGDAIVATNLFLGKRFTLSQNGIKVISTSAEDVEKIIAYDENWRKVDEVNFPYKNWK